jgi:hypothetical protein
MQPYNAQRSIRKARSKRSKNLLFDLADGGDLHQKSKGGGLSSIFFGRSD